MSPLSYIVGAMQGNQTITTWPGNRKMGQRQNKVRATVALEEANIKAVKLGPKKMGLQLSMALLYQQGVAKFSNA